MLREPQHHALQPVAAFGSEAHLSRLRRAQGEAAGQLRHRLAPLDFLAAGLRVPVDEFGLVGTLRGEPVPMVRGVTNGVLAPADAEMIIEGYFDELGYREQEGPYGEFYGFYGPVHIDPVFHVTAITARKDVLYQTVLHSGRYLSWTDSGNLGGLNAELRCGACCARAGIEPVAVIAVPASNGRQHARSP